MIVFRARLMVAMALSLSLPSPAVVRYVNVTNSASASPYTTWASAATTIQAAIDIASPGDLILVTNGVYLTGGRVVYGSLLNRVAVTKPLTVQSVNGPAVTTIQGVPSGGGGATRCAYLTNGAALVGFILTNGATRWDAGFQDSAAGGVWCETNAMVSNCVITGCGAEWAGGAYQGILENCTLSGNSAAWPGDGGGASGSTLNNCIITGNSGGINGGGANSCTLSNCVLAGNDAFIWGGGARECTLINCTLTNNTAQVGGAAVSSTLTNCVLSQNSAGTGAGAAGCTLQGCTLSGNSGGDGGGAQGSLLIGCTVFANSAGGGGGASSSTLKSCSVFGNSASSGGGVEGSSLTNCTVTGNTATGNGGGADNSTLENCIVYYNLAPSGSNYYGGSLDHSCTVPLPGAGSGNITSEPKLADFSHLNTNSPCRAAGSAGSASGLDIDGEAWANPPAIACDEYHAGAIAGPLSVAIQPSFTNVAAQFTVNLTALISGHAAANRWDLGDGTIVSNRVYLSHSWASAGNYTVTLTAYNESNPGGVSATVTMFVVEHPLHYVALSSTNPVAPYSSWATAATNLQDAADAAYAGGSVLVSNGIYQAGGRVVYGSLTNRLAVTRPIALQSVNGPALTIIQGNPTNGDSAVRCVYLTNGAALSGFTLSQGATRTDGDATREQSGGGVWCESVGVVVSNCVLTGNSANGGGGGAYGGTLNQCAFTGNAVSSSGGGASSATLSNCTLSTNSAAASGGGADSCVMTSCTLTGNLAGDSGGGAIQSTLTGCTLAGNSATNHGGGAYACTLNQCTLAGNSAGGSGGGAHNSTVNNSALNGNAAANLGGGAEGGALINCTLTGNSALSGGGVDSCTLNNCMVYYNSAARQANYSGTMSMAYCCTTPLPVNGSNNISAEPRLANASHLSAGSPCRGAGDPAFASGTDIDGEAWANPPAIGCDELHAGASTGPLSVAIQTSYVSVAAGFAVDFTALVNGQADASRWDFGDGTVVSNRPYASHTWAAPDDYQVELRAYNGSFPGGVTATITIHVLAQPVHYVALTSTNPVAPYASWDTAATNIQDAVDAASITGALVLVTNGTYNTGGRIVHGGLTNRVAVTKPVTVQSVNGPSTTVIQGASPVGGNAVRCAYLTNGAVLAGFTLSGGATWDGGDGDREQSGGGLWCESARAVASNCVITGNSANNNGGGAIGGTLLNCVLSTNSVNGNGGGAYASTLNGCLMSGNSAPNWGNWQGGALGGGADSCDLSNCTLSGNSAIYGGGGAHASALVNCTLTGNSSVYGGGGANSCNLYHCTLTTNSAWSGGGAAGGTLDRCTLSGNTGRDNGGAESSTLLNCVLSGNSARSSGGGAGGGTLNNCTLTGNKAGSFAGGANGSILNNCIVYYNSAPAAPNYSGGTLNYCCALPLPPDGTGNIAAEPGLADLAHLSATSPCRGAGSAAYVGGLDIDGETWTNPPSIGCDEYHAGAATGTLTVAISAPFTNVTVGLGLDFIAQVTGQANASRWEFGDGTVVSNRPYASHSWTALGDYPVVLRAYNDSYPAGVGAKVTVHVVTQPVHYVALDSTNPVAPYASWDTAATNIQPAVDAVSTVGALVLVSNGVYSTGARLVNNDVPYRLALTQPIVVQSVNGPAATLIAGQRGDPVRCAYLAGGAFLCGFTLTNGGALWAETYYENQICGGIWCDSTSAFVSNCIIAGCNAPADAGGAYGGTFDHCSFLTNSASWGGGGGAFFSTVRNCTFLGNSASAGGAAYQSTLSNCFLVGNAAGSGGGASLDTLNNCTLIGNAASAGGGADSSTVVNCAFTGNAASDTGGGANSSTLYNCTLSGNSATNSGGGVSNCTNFNSIVYYNLAPVGSNWVNSSFDHGCTLPLPGGGAGNVATEPLLADSFHLSAGSPCRGAGLAAYATGVDIEGEPWLNPPAIGCDEYQTGAVTGSLTIAIQTPYTNVAVGFTLKFQALIGGHPGASVWDFSDSTVVSNRPYTSHTWATPGDFSVTLTAFNESFPSGVSTTLTVHVQAPIHYVALTSTNPVAPYLSWTTAATNIQDAVDATFIGGTIFVSNGVYQTGGRVGSSLSSNRVCVTRQLTLASVNGPAATVIRGAQPSGSNAVRCVSLVRDCVLAGFTLIGGGTRTDGDGDLDQSGAGVWCDSTSVLVSNCVITANGGGGGVGGVLRGTLRYCVISTNSPGGVSSGVLDHCSVVGNSSTGAGGCTLTSCLIEGNSSYDAGGLYGCTLTNCTIKGNHADRYGGGSEASVMHNCLVIYNTAGYGGGGLYNDWAYNCTIVGNSAGSYGGGMLIASWLANCILYYNSAPNGPNYWSDYLFNCCSLPAYGGNSGNFADEPAFVNPAAGDLHLLSNSPCVNSGDNSYASAGTDLDGNPRIVGGTVDIGAYEFPSVVPFRALIQADYTNTVPGYAVNFSGLTFGGRATTTRWDFGDGTIVTNALTPAHSWSSFGDYHVVFQAYNQDNPGGVSATVTVHVAAQLVCHVNGAATNPVPPYATWATATTNIQDAADLAPFWATSFVLVTNGTYQTGGRVVYGSLTNRLVLPSGVTVRSVNGPAVTVIQGNPVVGDSAVRCVFLSSNASLAGFKLALGATRADGDYSLEKSGGGAWCQAASSVLSNCVLFGNTAAFFAGAVNGGTLYYCTLSSNSAPGFGSYAGAAYGSTFNNCALVGNSSPYGGAVCYSTLNNCLLTGNSAGNTGGAVAMFAVLNNCTLVGNSSGGNGGAADNCTLNNCIAYFNTAPSGPNYSSSGLNYCCTLPKPGGGAGNITNAPAFVDLADGNFRLQSSSSCINAGANSYVVGAADFEGRPRIVSGQVDIGAYEFQGATMNLFLAWLQQFGLPTDGSADYADPDGDGMNNWAEWIAGTNPTNALSALRLLTVTRNVSGVTVTWQSVSNRTYFLDSSANLAAHPAFLLLATNIAGQTGTTSFTDTNAVGPGPFFYRVGVQTGSNQFQIASSIIPFRWLQQYGLPTDGSADFTDPDHDGMNNWQEWRAGTDPTSALSALRMTSAAKVSSGIAVSWRSVANRTYYLQRSTNLATPVSFRAVVSNIVGQACATTHIDTNVVGSSRWFYRVGVQ